MSTPEEADNSQGGGTVDFHHAAKIGHVNTFIQALSPRDGSSPDHPDQLLFQKDSEGNTPFHLAARSGHRSIIEVFFKCGSQQPPLSPTDIVAAAADPSSSSNSTRRNNTGGEIEDDHKQDAGRTLWGRCITAVNGSGDLALHMALKNKECHDVAVNMIDSHPHLSCIVNNVRESPLYLAVESYCDKVVRKILFSSSSFVVDDDRVKHIVSGPAGKTPLHAAVIYHNWSALELLGDQKSSEGTTRECQEYIKKLRDIMINNGDEDGKTPLHYAVEEEQDDTVKLLMKASPLTACKYDKEGYTPLLRAAEQGLVKIIKIILKYCPYSLEFHHRDNGRTALHLANMEAESIVVCLTGTSMNDLVYERDDDGYTPLHFAVLHSDYEKVFALTFHGDCNWRVRSYEDEEKMMVRPVEYLRGKASKKFSSLAQLLASSYLDMTAERWEPRKMSSKWMKSMLNHIRSIIPRKNNNMVRNFIEHNMDKDDVNDKLSNIFLVGGLILTITFAAAFTIPGGINQKTGQAMLINSPHVVSTNSTLPEKPTSRLRKLSGPFLGFFIVSDSAAMIYSAIILIWYAWSFTSTTNKEKVRLLFQLGYFLFGCSLLTIFAFSSGFMAVTSIQKKEDNWLVFLLAGFSVSLIYGISGTLVINYFPVRGATAKLAINGRVILAYAKHTMNKFVKS